MLKVNNKDISMTPTDVVLVLLSLNLSMSSILIRLNFKEKTLSCGLILNKVESCMTATLLKETLAQVFSSENRDFFFTTLVIGDIQTAASEFCKLKAFSNNTHMKTLSGLNMLKKGK